MDKKTENLLNVYDPAAWKLSKENFDQALDELKAKNFLKLDDGGRAWVLGPDVVNYIEPSMAVTKRYLLLGMLKADRSAEAACIILGSALAKFLPNLSDGDAIRYGFVLTIMGFVASMDQHLIIRVEGS